jgi:acyl-CoA thioester hydrolase
MPLIHERAFRIRHYECDAYGHVNHTNYVRYMQEAAFDASAAAGFDMDWYTDNGRYWLIRETHITYLHPLAYGDTVIIKTWVADFHRVRSRRAYEFRLADSDKIVATAMTDWVYLDTAAQRPISIPAEMEAGFFPDGPPGNIPPRERFPKAPAVPPKAFSMYRQVEWSDIDPAGHVNNAQYLAYLETAGVAAVNHFGWPMTRMVENGFGVVARRYRIEYKQQAVMGDELEITTYITDAKRATVVRHYIIKRINDNAIIARAYALWVWVDLATGQPIRVPPQFVSDFEGHIVGK